MVKIDTTFGNDGNVIRTSRMPTGSAPTPANIAQQAGKAMYAAADAYDVGNQIIEHHWKARLDDQATELAKKAYKHSNVLKKEAESLPAQHSSEFYDHEMGLVLEDIGGTDLAPYVRDKFKKEIDRISLSGSKEVQIASWKRAGAEQTALFESYSAEIVSEFARTGNWGAMLAARSQLMATINETSLGGSPTIAGANSRKVGSGILTEALDRTAAGLVDKTGYELQAGVGEFERRLGMIPSDQLDGKTIKKYKEEIRKAHSRALTEIKDQSSGEGNKIIIDSENVESESGMNEVITKSIEHHVRQGDKNVNSSKDVAENAAFSYLKAALYPSIEDMNEAIVATRNNIVEEHGIMVNLESLKTEMLADREKKYNDDIADMSALVRGLTANGMPLTLSEMQTLVSMIQTNNPAIYNEPENSVGSVLDSILKEHIDTTKAQDIYKGDDNYRQLMAIERIYNHIDPKNRIETEEQGKVSKKITEIDEAHVALQGTKVQQNAASVVALILNGYSGRTTQFSLELEEALRAEIAEYSPDKKWDIYIGLHGSGYFVEDVRQGLEHLVKNGNIPSAVSYLMRMYRANGSIDQFHHIGEGKPTQVQWLAKNVGSLSPELLKALPNNPEELQRVIDIGEILTGILTNSASLKGKDKKGFFSGNRISTRYENVEYMGILRKAIFEGTGIGTADGKAFSRRDIDAIIGSLSLAVNKTSPDVALATLTGTSTDGEDEIMSAVIEKALKVLSPGELGMSKGGLGYIDRDNVIRSADKWPAMALLDAFQKTVEPEEYGGLSGWVSDLGINMASRGQRPFGVVTKPSPILRDLSLEEPHLNNSFAMVQEILPGAILSTENAIITNKVTGEYTMFIPFLDQGGEILGYIGLAADNNGLLSYSNGDGIVSTKYRYDAHQTDLQAGEVPIDSEYMALLDTFAEIKHSSVTYEDDKKPQSTGEEMTQEEIIDHYWRDPVVLEYVHNNQALSDEDLNQFIYEYAKEQGWSVIVDDDLSIEDQRVRDFGMDNN